MSADPLGIDQLQQTISDGGLIAITGASGWVGRTAVVELKRLLPPRMFDQRVRLFASRTGTLTLPAEPEHRGAAAAGAGAATLPVYGLDALVDLAASQPLDAVLHTAFLTRDRLAAVGLDQYVATNRWITGQVAQALRLAPAARAVVISSGAAALYDDSGQSLDDLARDPYGVLKHQEESTLADLASTQVLRIYALSGRFIRDPHRFALGDFLLSALRGEAIALQSPAPVWRSYGHAGDITAYAWRWLISADKPCAGPLAAVSVSVDLLTLAQTVTSLYGLPPVQSAVDPGVEPNRYLADPEPFVAAMAHHGLIPTPLEQQVLDTAAGLQWT